MLQDKRIAVVGVGKIGSALIAGMVAGELVPRENIVGSTAHQESACEISEQLRIRTFLDNAEMVAGCDVIILAVKPQQMAKVLGEIQGAIHGDQLVITLAAATTTRFVEERLASKVPVVRAMPNTPCQVRSGMTGLCAGRFAGPQHLDVARALFSTVGRVATVEDEELMDAVTALSGSGPAYAYIIIEALAEGGVKMGLPRRLATELAAQAILGGAGLVLASGQHPALLKDDVTTPAGVTIDGLMALEEGGIRVALIRAVMAATERGKALSR